MWMIFETKLSTVTFCFSYAMMFSFLYYSTVFILIKFICLIVHFPQVHWIMSTVHVYYNNAQLLTNENAE